MGESRKKRDDTSAVCVAPTDAHMAMVNAVSLAGPTTIVAYGQRKCKAHQCIQSLTRCRGARNPKFLLREIKREIRVLPSWAAGTLARCGVNLKPSRKPDTAGHQLLIPSTHR